jgi:hypothetical protein
VTREVGGETVHFSLVQLNKEEVTLLLQCQEGGVKKREKEKERP